MTEISVLVIDDHPVVSQGVSELLRDSPATVVAAAGTATEGIDLAQRLTPDVVLLDVRLPDLDAALAVRRLRASAPGSKILLFTSSPAHPSVRGALSAGAVGCLPKETEPRRLIEAIQRVHASGALDQDQAPSPEIVAELTPRQRQILTRVAMGETNREIADALQLTPNTVKTYWQGTLQKLGARNRVEAITRAYEIGLL